jgi:hypothetical protein
MERASAPARRPLRTAVAFSSAEWRGLAKIMIGAKAA